MSHLATQVWLQKRALTSNPKPFFISAHTHHSTRQDMCTHLPQSRKQETRASCDDIERAYIYAQPFRTAILLLQRLHCRWAKQFDGLLWFILRFSTPPSLQSHPQSTFLSSQETYQSRHSLLKLHVLKFLTKNVRWYGTIIKWKKHELKQILQTLNQMSADQITCSLHLN